MRGNRRTASIVCRLFVPCNRITGTKQRLCVLIFPVDNFLQMHYDCLINSLSVKGAHRTFRQFLPDFFTHWQKTLQHLCMSSACLFQKERILHETGFLLYIAAEYEGLVAKMNANIYGQTLIPLPAPQCVVFYNGEEKIADEQYLCLTDAFAGEKGMKSQSCLKLTVRMLNINYGHNPELMAACKRLNEYSCFVGRIKKCQQKGLSTDQSIDDAVIYCIDHGIMDDILLPFRAEVKKCC